MTPTNDGQAVVLADASGSIRYWSDGAERLLGHPAAAAVGRSLDLIVPAEYRERHWAAFHRAMASGQCRLDRAATHLPVRCHDGRVRVFPARFVFLADGHGRPVGALAVYSAPDGERPPFSPIEPPPAQG